MVVVGVAACAVEALVLEEEVQAAVGRILVHGHVARTLRLHVQELRPVDTLVGAVVELEVDVVARCDGVDDDVGLALCRLALIVVDVLVVLAGLIELAVLPLCAEVEAQRLAVVVLRVGGGVEAAIASLADGTEERAVVHLDDLGFVAALNHGGLAEVPRFAAVSGVEDVVLRVTCVLGFTGHRLSRDEVHQDVVLGDIQTATGSHEVVIETEACGTCGGDVLDSAAPVEVNGRVALAAAPGHTIVGADRHTHTFLAVEVAFVASGKKAIELAVLTLHEAGVAEAATLVVAATGGGAFALGDGHGSAPRLTAVGAAAHHDVDDVSAVADVGVTLITLVGGHHDAAVVSHNHGGNTIDAAAVVARQEGIAADVEDHSTAVGRIADRGQVEVLCRLAFHLIGDACHGCIEDSTQRSRAAHRSTNPIVVCASSKVSDSESGRRAGDGCRSDLRLRGSAVARGVDLGRVGVSLVKLQG